MAVQAAQLLLHLPALVSNFRVDLQRLRAGQGRALGGVNAFREGGVMWWRVVQLLRAPTPWWWCGEETQGDCDIMIQAQRSGSP